MRQRFIVHPVLLAILPILSLYSHNVGELSLSELLIPTAVAAAASVLLWLLLGLILRDRVHAGLVASSFWVWFFSYGHVLALIEKSPAIGMLIPERYSFTIFYCVLLLASVVVLIRYGRKWHTASSILNIVALALIAWHVATVGHYEVRRLRAERRLPEMPYLAAGKVEGAQDPPNIYYIVLDGYARADVLADLYDYDNSKFLDYLKGKGFFVAEGGRANYCQTVLSVGSCLNLDYLDDLAERMGPGSEDRQPLEKMVEDSRLRRFLGEQGYRIVAFSSGYPQTEMLTADPYLGPVLGLSQFQSVLLNTTPVPSGLVSRALFEIDEAESHRRRVVYACQHLPDTARLQPPVFVFAHIVCPHPPFLFDRNGKPVKLTVPFRFNDGTHFEGSREEYVGSYTEQVIFINRQMRTALDGLLESARYPTVIILQSDHGPGSRLNWGSAEKTDLRERFATLSAYYLAGARDVPWTHDVSAVNVFRIVLNRYFGTDLPLLPNESYFSSMVRPYRFVRVTDGVDGDPREP